MCCYFKVGFNYFLMLFYCIILACSPISAQKTESAKDKLLFEIPVEAINFATDKLGQCYILTPPNELIQYSNRGKEYFRYNNNTLGTLHLIDATDPFSILLFYKDFSTIITLDRTLNKTGEINLLDLDIVNVEAVGASNDNNIWLYDEVAFKLKKINRAGEVVRESDPLSLIFDSPLEVNFILERNNQVFLNDPLQGIFIFDLYGRYLRKMDIKGLVRFQIIDERIIYRKEKDLYTFHLKTLREQLLQLPIAVKREEEIFLQKDRMFVVEKSKVKLYELN